jgi:hypothetical protein
MSHLVHNEQMKLAANLFNSRGLSGERLSCSYFLYSYQRHTHWL